MKTKHIFITLFAMLAAFLATSCTDKDSLTGTEAPGSTRTLSFNLTTDAQAQTRATTSSAPSVAGYKVQYILQVLDADGNDYGSQVTNETGTFEVELPVGVAYTCLFWAQYIPTTGGSGTSEYFTTDDLKAVALKDVLTAEDQCQAFCATADVTANQAAATNTVILKRAVAQVNLRSNEDLKYYDKIEATYSDVPNVFNVKDNTVSTSGTTGVPSTFSITETDISADGDSKFTFHSVYFLARGDGNANLLKIELNTYNEGDPTAIQTLTVPNVPTKKNYKTNVTATLDAASFTHNFTFDYAEWETTELEPEPDKTSVWDGTVPAPNAAYTFGAGGGDGSSESTAYIIADAADFAQLMANVNNGTDYDGKFFKLDVDINLDNHEWTPIGTETAQFKGSFNGDHHRITGLKINSAEKYLGLFGYKKNKYLINLHVSGDVISTNNTNESGNIENHQATGGIVGGSIDSKVRSCSFEGTVTAAKGNVGGIVGIQQGMPIENCKNSGTITGGKHAGGIAGATCYDGDSQNCYNTGTVKGYTYAGGLTGATYQSSVICCYNIGEVSSNDPALAGAIYGDATDAKGSIVDCYCKEKYRIVDDNETVFANGAWPNWAVDSSGTGADSSWKSLGGWNSGGNTIEYPKLWWEK